MASTPRDHLEPLELVDRIRLGMNCLVRCLDPDEGHVPYWNCGFSAGNVTQLKHAGAADRAHNIGRALHAIRMASEATGEAVDPQVIEHLADHQIAVFDEADELPGAPDETGTRRVNLHDVRENLHGLTALIKLGDERAERWARRMVRRLLGDPAERGAPRLDNLPPYVESPGWWPHKGGRAVDALVRYYRASGDEAALELATRVCDYALAHCFTPSGSLTEEAGTHGHSINALVAGIADLGLLTRDAELLWKARRVYDVGLPRFNSSFGWSMESLTRFDLRGESNNTGDLLRAALLLGKAGWPQYFEAAERILRSHLLPSQVLDVEGFADDPGAAGDHLRSIGSRIRGGFSFPTPNDYLVSPDAPIVTYDITSGAVDGLCEALLAAVTRDAMGARVNLLLSRRLEGTCVDSGLSREGRLHVKNTTGRNLFVRLPGWVPARDVRVTADGAPVPTPVVNGYLVVSGSHRDVNVSFPMRRCRTRESISYHVFTIGWQGDQIVAMSPAAKYLPMFPTCEDT